ncbi:hypothetical protein MC885_020346, partial [Smutsia gigantea]
IVSPDVGKKVLIVYAHEEPRSFNGSLKKVAVDELRKQGCSVTVSDLYAMDFEPRATRRDITGTFCNPEFFNYGVESYEACKTRSLTSDIIDEQKKVLEADLVIFQVCFSSNYYSELDSFYTQTLSKWDLWHRASVQENFPMPPCLLRHQHKGAATGGTEPPVTAARTIVSLSRPMHQHNVHIPPQSLREEPSPPALPLWVTCTCPVTWEEESGLPSGWPARLNPKPETTHSVCFSLVLRPQFPLYWFSVPAILKGWMDRVLCQGFAFDIPGFYDSGFLKNKLALLSFTTGSTAEMYTKTGVSGDFRYFLWPLQHGTLHFCGFKVLAPQISFGPELVSEEERREMITSWAQRLRNIWKEEPIHCTPSWYFGQ